LFPILVFLPANKSQKMLPSLTGKDIDQIRSRGITLQTIEEQIGYFVNGIPYIDLVAPATAGHGIRVFSEQDVNTLARHYRERSGQITAVKFVPASGAASRMFKHLFEFVGTSCGEKDQHHLLNDETFASVKEFIDSLDRFAFYGDLTQIAHLKGRPVHESLAARDYHSIIRHLLGDEGLNYAFLPKGLLKFHSYPEGARTAMEEHLVEGSLYCKDRTGKVAVQFTVSPEHLDHFRSHWDRIRPYYERLSGHLFDVTFSLQQPSTDTLAVDMDNRPFRDDNGRLVFRPGGHGALIHNLNDLKRDIIFIKNIDNVVPDRLKAVTVLYKQALAGYLLQLQSKIFSYIRALEGGEAGDALFDEISIFCRKEMLLQVREDLPALTSAEKTTCFLDLLSRPVRVCGMVKNVGEPGGGPFWVKDRDGRVSLQIVEASQINRDDPDQKAILRGSTHFNPVDLVCGVKDAKGRPYDLTRFIDPSTGFVSVKSKDGRELKALELPGLWNGAMAQWITVFVEVPLGTFNPVKTVNDLLRENHR
jgi:hypothetical protein